MVIIHLALTDFSRVIAGVELTWGYYGQRQCGYRATVHKRKQTDIPADNCDSLYTSQSLSLLTVMGNYGQRGQI
jgi:hypothetical protein